MIPNDKDTLMLLYGSKNNNPNNSIHSMRGRNLSPSQQFLMESISSRERLHESVYISPTTQKLRNEGAISPELNYENYRFMSEGRASPHEGKDMHNIEMTKKPKSALGDASSKRHMSMPKIRTMSKHSMSNSRIGIPTYFKDAAELLISRLLRQVGKNFDIIKSFANGKLFNYLTYKERKIQQMREESQVDIIQPSNKNIRIYERPQRTSIDNLKQKRRGLTPTEFLSNTDEYGRLKDSNESIFSFGTSKRNNHNLITNYRFIRKTRHDIFKQRLQKFKLGQKNYKRV